MKYVAVILLTLLVGCTKPFQPMKPGYKLWSKAGASDLDVKKAMLECGEPTPDPTVQSFVYAFGLRDDDSQLNYFFLTDSCMENAGFKPHRYTVAEYCSWDRHKHLPACQPGAEIPEPSVERRVNSWWCKIKTDYEYCKQHAVNPPACDPEGYKKPPPECLP